MSHFPFQTGDSIEVHTKALFSGPFAHLVGKSNESGSNITDTEGRQRETQPWVRDEEKQNNGPGCAVTAAVWGRTTECRWFCNEGLSGGLWVFIKMFLILIRLNLVSGHRFHADSLDWPFSGGRGERKERKEDRETCASIILLCASQVGVYVAVLLEMEGDSFTYPLYVCMKAFEFLPFLATWGQRWLSHELNIILQKSQTNVIFVMCLANKMNVEI